MDLATVVDIYLCWFSHGVSLFAFIVSTTSCVFGGYKSLCLPPLSNYSIVGVKVNIEVFSDIFCPIQGLLWDAKGDGWPPLWDG